MSIIMILGAIAALVAVTLSGFVAGSLCGNGKAEAKGKQQRNKENTTASVASAERKPEVTKEANKV